jgi:hypothetical protein
MQDEHVVMVVDDALAGGRELSYDVDKRACCAGCVEPRLSQSNGFEQLRLLFLD